MDTAAGIAAGGGADRGAVTAVLEMMKVMNLTTADLVEVAAAKEVPTIAELVPMVLESMSEGSRQVYPTYLTKLVARWGARRLDEFDVGEARMFLAHVQETALTRHSSTDGIGAMRHGYRALSLMYRYAVDHGLIDMRQNVMRLIHTPTSGQARRHALSPQLVSEILGAARATGRDPVLDALLLRFHLETAARTGGALALRLRDLDPDQSLVRLREKGGTQRWQPVSPTLMEHLLHHARERGVRGDDGRVLRLADGRPLTRSRYDALWDRVGTRVDSVRVLGVSTHWLRHTTLTWVERNFGFAVARAYAGHAEPKFNVNGVTQVYVKAGLAEVATALQALTRERHPLALVPVPAPTVTGADTSPVTDSGRADHGGIGRPTPSEGLRTEGAMDTVVGESLVERIRQLFEEAERAGRLRPGVRALARVTGASHYRIKVALTKIDDGAVSRDGERLVEQVRELFEEADRAGKRRPSARDLMRATGAKQHQVKVARTAVGPVVSRRGPAASGAGATG
jgi:integrase